jgi:uncharacterized RDD family membrane protein YckC
MSSDLRGYYAGFVSRLIAWGIDAFILSISVVVIGWFISTAFQVLGLDLLNVSEQIYSFLANPILKGVMIIGYIYIYYVFFFTSVGQTPGKAVMGLRVVGTDGKRLTIVRAIIRTIGYTISAIPMFLGYFMVLLDNRRQALHDKMARSYVIYTWEARMDENFMARALRKLGLKKEDETEKTTGGTE